MKSFRAADIDWIIDITVGTLKRVKGMVGVDLCALQEKNLGGLGELVADPVKFIDTLFVICKKQADAAGVTDEAFGEMFHYSSLNAATTAFVGAYFDFFLSPDQAAKAQQLVEKVSQKHSETVTGLLVDAVAKAETFDPTKSSEERSKKQSGNLLDSSESTRNHAPLAS